MLIVPMTRTISWSNPPVITIVLLLVNCLVYFGIQSGDAEKSEKAWTHYEESGLARMEITRFVEHLKATGRTGTIPTPPDRKLDDPLVFARLHHAMTEDADFMGRLNSDQIIQPEDPEYSRWRSLKAEQERLSSEITSTKYGYKPAAKNPTTAFTYMFLHGSLMHLLGNMVFLWLVGCILELAGSRSAYTGIYLLTGVISALCFGLVYKTSAVPLVGASGAISGIIGAYTVLYGRTKVKIFYSLGFYFGYARMSAIFLLPVWIGNEVFQLFFGGVSNVAYVAHIGGLVSGAVLGLGQKRFFGGVKSEPVEDDRSEKIASLMESGLQKLSELDLRAARSLRSFSRIGRGPCPERFDEAADTPRVHRKVTPGAEHDIVGAFAP
jgi:membrane associated rhomboid family serine protease